MDRLTKVGTLIYAIPIGVLGIINIMNGIGMSAYIPAYFPVPVIWIYFIGIFLIAASVSIIIQKYTRLVCLLLSLLLFIFVFFVHLPGLFNPQTSQIALSNLLKDTALGGGALVIAAVSNIPEPL